MTRRITMAARTTSVWKLLALGILAQASLAQAQQTPSSAPPKLERIPEGSDTPITVTPQEQQQRNKATKIVEKRQGGRVTEVQVSTGKSSYTMKANPPDAVAQPGDPASGSLRPPQWKVLEFDFGKKKPKEAAEASGEATPAPPPPPPPTK
jgi:hypothetical protein